VPYWTDETWGPRYLLPVAWLLLVPIPWWATTRRRRQALVVVAAIAVAVQFVAVIVPEGQIVASAERLTGSPLYQQRGPGQVADAPFGDDSIRWIPQLSPLLIQASLLVSRIAEHVGAGPITLRYAPYEGRARKLVFSDQFASGVGFTRPDFWWIQPDAGRRGWLVALAGLTALASGALLVQASRASVRQSPLATDAQGAPAAE
jgi:hypothetical protein